MVSEWRSKAARRRERLREVWCSRELLRRVWREWWSQAQEYIPSEEEEVDEEWEEEGDQAEGEAAHVMQLMDEAHRDFGTNFFLSIITINQL